MSNVQSCTGLHCAQYRETLYTADLLQIDAKKLDSTILLHHEISRSKEDLTDGADYKERPSNDNAPTPQSYTWMTIIIFCFNDL